MVYLMPARDAKPARSASRLLRPSFKKVVQLQRQTTINSFPSTNTHSTPTVIPRSFFDSEYYLNSDWSLCAPSERLLSGP